MKRLTKLLLMSFLCASSQGIASCPQETFDQAHTQCVGRSFLGEVWGAARLFMGDLVAPFTPHHLKTGLIEPNVEALQRLSKSYAATPLGVVELCLDHPAETLDIVGALFLPPAKGTGRHLRNFKLAYDTITAIPNDTQGWRLVKGATTVFTLALAAQEFDLPALLPGAEAHALPQPHTISHAFGPLVAGGECTETMRQDLDCVLNRLEEGSTQDQPPCPSIDWRVVRYGVRYDGTSNSADDLDYNQVFRSFQASNSPTVCVQGAFNIFAPVFEMCTDQKNVSVTAMPFTLEDSLETLRVENDRVFVVGGNAQECATDYAAPAVPVDPTHTVCVAVPSPIAKGYNPGQTLVMCLDPSGHVGLRGLAPDEAHPLDIDAWSLTLQGGYKVLENTPAFLETLRIPTRQCVAHPGSSCATLDEPAPASAHSHTAPDEGQGLAYAPEESAFSLNPTDHAGFAAAPATAKSPRTERAQSKRIGRKLKRLQRAANHMDSGYENLGIPSSHEVDQLAEVAQTLQ
ncbi:MAG: hypothetical protein C0514_09000 [Candidatus Puniceispirillum sp.]|nr:hypothetical protein [Candidatus Puniceispirillum sp.]